MTTKKVLDLFGICESRQLHYTQ